MRRLAFLATLAALAAHGAGVGTAKFGDLGLDDNVVTNVDLSGLVMTEEDPTVPAWAKAASKPSYSWGEISSKPSFATVATSGSYADLTDRPEIPDISGKADKSSLALAAQSATNYTDSATNDLWTAIPSWARESNRPSYSWGEISSKPSFATVATSGSYADLTDRPTIASVALTNETLYVNGWKTNVVTRYANGAVTFGSRTRTGAVGALSVAEGYNTTASGAIAHAEGNNTTARGSYSHAEGNFTTASGNCSHAEGNFTTASGGYSHAEGDFTTASGNYSHSVGRCAYADHHHSWCWQGVDTITYYYSHGPGTFNINPAGGTDGFWIGETNFAQHVRNIAGSGGGSAAPRRVAMFVIPVNEGMPFTYKGFELKCSTNNFASAASESVKLQFYSQSEIADTGSGPTSGSLGIDKMKLFACTSYWSSRDRRSYSPIGNTIDYGNDLYSVVALVDVSCLKRHPEDNGSWLSEDNEDLVWCYLRDTANDVDEREELTTEPLWRPIAPVKWFRELPSWAR